ncbi:MAG: uroporphyrinogen-III synthase [Bacteroidia bacterium]|nr:MAG: uroporphyrinogen-III synthase [Bacteroidia bacterium]
MKIKHVLISQPPPENDKSPYADLIDEYNLNVCFRKFIKIESVGTREFRKHRIQIPEHSAIIFTSKNGIDHFFSLCEELRVQVSEQMKYFCTSEAIALYLQKYVQFRKRKIFYGKNHISDLIDVIKKNKEDKFLFPCAENHKKDIPQLLKQNKIPFSVAPIYRSVPEDISDVDIGKYQMLVFFSPFGIQSLRLNFPDYEQGDTVIATFGKATLKAAEKDGLKVQIAAPTKTAPSMVMAMQEYLKSAGK